MQSIPQIFGPFPKNISPLPDTSHNRPEMKQNLHKEKGFTLIEIMVVIVIIGILASITIGLTMSFKEKAHIRSIEADLASAFKGSVIFFSDNPDGVLTLELLETHGFAASKDVSINVVDPNWDSLRITATHPNVIKTYVVDNTGNIFTQ